MHKIERILVPVDFSPGSHAALDYALFIAGHFGARLDVLHAWAAPAYVSPYLAVHATDGPGTIEAIARGEADARMKRFISEAPIPPGIEVNTRIEFGTESQVITDAARDYDLVVMGTHGRSGLAHLFMGSIAEKVVRTCLVPVITVRLPAAAPSEGS